MRHFRFKKREVAKVLGAAVLCFCAAVHTLPATPPVNEFTTVVHLPEPPKNFLEIVAVSTIFFVAWWGRRRAT